MVRIWGSKEWGAMKYFSQEYRQMKEEMGRNYNHFRLLPQLRARIQENGRWEEWRQWVQANYENAPVDNFYLGESKKENFHLVRMLSSWTLTLKTRRK